jgi:hypothetical protein
MEFAVIWFLAGTSHTDKNRCRRIHLERHAGVAMGIAMLFEMCRAIGLFGVGVILVAYFANQQRWLSSEDWRFPAANLLGSLLILASLFVEWNTPSVVIELFWIAISLYGLVRCPRPS